MNLALGLLTNWWVLMSYSVSGGQVSLQVPSSLKSLQACRGSTGFEAASCHYTLWPLGRGFFFSSKWVCHIHQARSSLEWPALCGRMHFGRCSSETVLTELSFNLMQSATLWPCSMCVSV